MHGGGVPSLATVVVDLFRLYTHDEMVVVTQCQPWHRLRIMAGFATNYVGTQVRQPYPMIRTARKAAPKSDFTYASGGLGSHIYQCQRWHCFGLRQGKSNYDINR